MMVINHRRFKTRKPYEQPLLDVLKEPVDIVTASNEEDDEHDNSFGDFDDWED